MKQPFISAWRPWLYRLVAVVAAWSVFMLLAGIGPVLDGFFTWGEALRMTLNQWLPWMLMSMPVFWCCDRFPIERAGWLRRAGLHLLLAGACISFGTWMSNRVFMPTSPTLGRDRLGGPPPLFGERAGEMGPNLPGEGGPPGGPGNGGPPEDRRDEGPPGGRGGGGPPGERRQEGPPVWVRLRISLPIYLTLASLGHAFAYFRRSQQRDRRTLELETQLGLARLQTLRMQLHPHFLFNTLNAISTLVRANPEAATEMIGSLGQMLRLSLDSEAKAEVPLEQELEFLDSYLEIEQIRFGDRLTVRREIAPEIGSALVPSFILQPLVENAIRHGIEPNGEPGTIEISARRAEGRLIILIRDSGVGLTEAAAADPPERNGIGIPNTKARLRSLYAEAHRFSVRNAAHGGCVAELEIPYHIRPLADPKVSPT